MNNDYLATRSITIEGQKTLINEDIKMSVRDYLSHNFFTFIRRDNIIFLNTNRIEEHIKKLFPKIEDIHISIQKGDNLVVHISERLVHSLWCIDKEYEFFFEEECYFADKEGLLYAKAPYFSEHVYMKFFIPQKEDEVYIGTRIKQILILDDFFDFINELEEKYNIGIRSITFHEFGDVSIDISRLQSILFEKSRPIIMYNQSSDYTTIIRNIGVIFDFDDFKKRFKKRPYDLVSLDLRFYERAFYTFIPHTKSKTEVAL